MQLSEGLRPKKAKSRSNDSPEYFTKDSGVDFGTFFLGGIVRPREDIGSNFDAILYLILGIKNSGYVKIRVTKTKLTRLFSILDASFNLRTQSGVISQLAGVPAIVKFILKGTAINFL